MQLPSNTKVDELLACITLLIDDQEDQEASESLANAVSAHLRLTVLLWIRSL